MKYFVHSSSRLGNRKSNQDRSQVCAKDNCVLLLIADGVGGHEGGDLAAEMFINTMTEYFYQQSFPLTQPRAFLQRSVQLAHQNIQSIKTKNGGKPKTTCVCCLIQNDLSLWLHCGDSRCYLIREQQVCQQTQDHTYVQNLVKQKLLSDEETKSHPMRNYIYACLGGKQDEPHLSFSPLLKLQAEDKLLLCTDGLWSALPENEILNIIESNALETAIEKLTGLAEQQSWPHSDNVSAIGFHCLSCQKHIDKNNTEANTVNTQATIVAPEQSLKQAIDDINAAYKQYENEFKTK